MTTNNYADYLRQLLRVPEQVPGEPCPLHNLADCATCYRLDGECDYGACHERATSHVRCYADGSMVEIRPACSRHATYSPFGVGYDIGRR